jgi:hypothetical protein
MDSALGHGGRWVRGVRGTALRVRVEHAGTTGLAMLAARINDRLPDGMPLEAEVTARGDSDQRGHADDEELHEPRVVRQLCAGGHECAGALRDTADVLCSGVENWSA